VHNIHHLQRVQNSLVQDVAFTNLLLLSDPLSQNKHKLLTSTASTEDHVDLAWPQVAVDSLPASDTDNLASLCVSYLLRHNLWYFALFVIYVCSKPVPSSI